MEGKGVYVVPPPGQKRSRDILISVDLRTVSRNIIQILNWKRYLAIVNACGSFHRGAPRVKPAPATESYSRDAPPTRETFSPFPLPPPPFLQPGRSNFRSITPFFAWILPHRRFFWKSPSRFFLPCDLSRFFFQWQFFPRLDGPRDFSFS